MTMKLAFLFCLIFVVCSMEKRHPGETLLQQQKELDKSFEKLEQKLQKQFTSKERLNAQEESLQGKEEMLEEFAEDLYILEDTLKKRETSLRAAEKRLDVREHILHEKSEQMQQLEQDLQHLEDILTNREKSLKIGEKDLQEHKERLQKDQERFNGQELSQKLLAEHLKEMKEDLQKREQTAEEKYHEREENLKQMKESLYEWEQRLIGQAKMLVNKNIDFRLIRSNDENAENVLEHTEHKQNIFVLTSTVVKPLDLYPNDSTITIFRDIQTNEIFWQDPKILIPREKKEEIETALQHSGETMSNAIFDSISTVFWNVLAEARPFMKELIVQISESVDLERRGEFNQTPLILACKLDVEKAVATLVEREATLDSVDDNLWTALHFAAAFGNKASCKILLQKGANANAQDKNGKTALMQATGKGHVEIVKLLLEFGAETNIRNKYDSTALYCAHPKCADAIREHEAKLKN